MIASYLMETEQNADCGLVKLAIRLSDCADQAVLDADCATGHQVVQRSLVQHVNKSTDIIIIIIIIM